MKASFFQLGWLLANVLKRPKTEAKQSIDGIHVLPQCQRLFIGLMSCTTRNHF
jgi:hypothetical protein